MSGKLPQLDLPAPSLSDFRGALERQGIAIIDDEPDLGFLSFRWNELLAYVGTRPHEAYIPLKYVDETETEERGPLDEAYGSAMKELIAALGLPEDQGTFTYSHRDEGQHYHYCYWQLKNCRLVLTQDERDIQFGLDLSVRYIYDDGPLEPLIFGASG